MSLMKLGMPGTTPSPGADEDSVEETELLRIER